MLSINSTRLTDVLKLCNWFMSDLKIDFESDGATVILGDTSGVCRTKISLKKEWFVSYNPSVSSIAVALRPIQYLVNYAGKNSNILFTIDSNHKEISVAFTNAGVNYTTTFVKLDESYLKQTKYVPNEFFEKLNAMWNTYELSISDYSSIMTALKPVYSDPTILNKIITFEVEDGIINFTCGDKLAEIGVISASIGVKAVTINRETFPFNSLYSAVYSELFKIHGDICDSSLPYTMSIGELIPLRINGYLKENTGTAEILIAPMNLTD